MICNGISCNEDWFVTDDDTFAEVVAVVVAMVVNDGSNRLVSI